MTTDRNLGTSAPAALSARERDMLTFEREWILEEGHKQDAIRERFGIAPSYYYRLLAKLIARPEAADADPLLVRRLRRRRRRRSASPTGLTEQVRDGGIHPLSK